MSCIPTSRPWHLSALSRLLALILITQAAAISWAQNSAQAESKAQTGRPARYAAGYSDEIRAMIEKYAKSIDDADTALASQVWLDSPDVSFIHPQGHEHGFEQIKEDIYKRLMGDVFSERNLTVHDVSVHVLGDTAWAEFYWDFTAKIRKDGSPVTTHGRETQIYRTTKEGWRLVHVHYSGLPVTPAPRNPGF
jgi:ketosteroid isomerase-like protein